MGSLAPLLSQNLHCSTWRFEKCCIAQREVCKCFLSPARTQTNWVLTPVPARISKQGAEAPTPIPGGGGNGVGRDLDTDNPSGWREGRAASHLSPVAGHCPPSWETGRHSQEGSSGGRYVSTNALPTFLLGLGQRGSA